MPAIRYKHTTREAWLTAACGVLQPLFGEAGVDEYPKLRVSCGFPKGARGGHTIGQCWDPGVSADGTFELFISPEMVEVDRVLDILAHELVHAVVGIKAGHRGPFKKLATAIGLEGKMTATVASETLKDRLLHLSQRLGPYPHAAMKPGGGVKKQPTRMRKCECGECGYTLRATTKWLDVAVPDCPSCKLKMDVEEPKE